MVRYRSHTPKHPSQAAPGKADRIWLRRIIFLSAKLRARKPFLKGVFARLSSKVYEKSLSTFPYSDSKEIESIPKEPLIDPRYWHSLPRSFVKPEMPDVDPARVAIAQPGYAGIPLEEIKGGWIILYR